MNNFFLTSISKAINAYLKLDPESTIRFANLQGKTITIELLPFHFNFQCVCKEEGIEVISEGLLPSDTIIRGTPLQLLNVMMTKERYRFFAEDVVIEGNAEIGQQVINLFDELEIDWENLLASFIGDSTSFQIGRFIRGVKEKLIKSETRLSQNINEFIHEELGWLPTREALEDFFQEIDLFRLDVDRLEAKIKHLHHLYENPYTERNNDEESQ